MEQYPDFWKKFLTELKQEWKEFDAPYDFKKYYPEFIHPGFLSAFGCQIKRVANNEAWRDLASELKKDSVFRNKLTGHLDVSMDDQSNIILTYIPFSIELMMDRYLTYQNNTDMKDELYKWEVVKEGHAIINKYKQGELSFGDAFSSLPFKNLVSTYTQPVWKAILEKDPSEMEDAFNALLSNDLGTQEKIESFQAPMIELHAMLNDARFNNHSQEERAIATLLTFIDPAQYTFFIDGFYANLARCISDGPKRAGRKLEHYYQLVNEFINGPLKDYEDVIAIKNRLIQDEKYYKDNDNRLLAQDIFYNTFLKDNWKPNNETEVKETEDVEKELIEALSASRMEHVLGYFQVLDLLKESIDLNEFEKITFSAKQKSLNMIVGQRYSWNLMSWRPVNRRFGFISDKKIGSDSELYDREPKSYYSNSAGFELALGNLKSIVKALKTELSRTQKSSFKRNENSLFREIIFDKNLRAKYLNQLPGDLKKSKMKPNPINMILYGPPGTGKTYRLKNEYFSKYEEGEISITPEQNFIEVTKNVTWWQALALDLIEAGGSAKVGELLESRWLKAVSENSSAKNVRASIWGTLQTHTIEESETVNITRRLPPLIFDKNEKSVWSILMENVNEQCPEILDLKEKVDHFSPKADKLIKRYVFTTFHQAFAYEDFIEGIKPVMDGDVDGEVRYQIELGVFRKLCKQAEKDPENKYAIFIDEINRGNIANIFGELITLIETNKRAGLDDAISVTLPYSKEVFSVPSNLDIYGTMNTADRSIEALDSALRRRFVFEELMPDPSLISLDFNGIELSEVLKVINKRIEVLIDRDHQIGHAYFLKLGTVATENQIKDVFADEIIPLLQEYFYNDYVKIGMVLGKGFVVTEGVEIERFAKISGSVASDYTDQTIYKINPELKYDSFDLEDALKGLLNIKTDEQGS